MSASGLFIPTYGRKSESVVPKEQQHEGPKGRTLPPVTSTSQSRKHQQQHHKRSLLPALVFNGNIEYIQTFESAEKAGRAIEAARPHALGFDIEWQVSFVPGEAPRRTATLQLCVPEHPSRRPEHPGSTTETETFSCSPSQVSRQLLLPVWGTTFIFHLCHIRTPQPPNSNLDSSARGPTESCLNDSSSRDGAIDGTVGAKALLPECLVRVLCDPEVLLLGVGVRGDVCRLEKEYEQLQACGIKGVIDLSELAKRKVAPERRRRGMWSLADLCAEMLHLDLRKPNELRRGSWEKRPLSVDQLFYAAGDAYAGLRLWQEMDKMPDLLWQPSSKGPRYAMNAPNLPLSMAGGIEVASLSSGPCDVSGDVAVGVSGDMSGDMAGCKGAVMLLESRGSGVQATGDSHGNANVTSANSNDGIDNEVQALAIPLPPPLAERPAQQSQLSLSKLETHRMWHEDGLSVEVVADVRCVKTSTVLGYIADCIEAGLPFDWRRLTIDPCKEAGIVEALMAATETQTGAAEAEEATAVAAALSPRAAITSSTLPSPELFFAHATTAIQTDDDGTALPIESQQATIHRAEVGRWDNVRLKEVKALMPAAEYWQIRMVLARFKSGWSGQ